MALAEKTDNDIRACLSTLQFFKSRGKYMRAVDVHKANIGQKDAHKSLRSIWEDLFQVNIKDANFKLKENIDFP